MKIATVILAATFLAFSAAGSVAQVSDPRVILLEEQVRALTGKIEELNFQILQLQEQMRRVQEDNEFRFQELEEKRTDAGDRNRRTIAGADEPAKNTDDSGPNKNVRVLGEPPRTLGTITLDGQGNVISGTLSDPADAIREGTPPSDDTTVAALPGSDTAEQLYQNAYEFILSGDYGTAEAGFRDHIERYPGNPQSADAHYWLGEALLGQGRNREAAEVFLSASQDYPNAKKAPDMLLKLGVALVELDQKKVACATFREAASRYSDVSDAFRQRLAREQQAAAC